MRGSTKSGTARKYRSLVSSPGLTTFQVMVKETDLLITAPRDLSAEARTSILTHRRYIEDRIHQNREFLDSLNPLPLDSVADELAPEIIKEMLAAAWQAGTGPMAAVAGALAHRVGRDLLAALDDEAGEVIVENGGDLFLSTGREVTVSVYAGDSPLSKKIGLKIPPSSQPAGLSTSSGTVGHSLSFGKADAAVVLSNDPARSDALATALGNRVGSIQDIKSALTWLSRKEGVEGGLVIVEGEFGAWGELELVSF
jgi:uncharacterized protein